MPIAPDIPSAASTSTPGSTPGSRWRDDDALVRRAERARRRDVVALAQRQHLAAHGARERRPADEADHEREW